MILIRTMRAGRRTNETMNKLLKKALHKYQAGDSRGAAELYRKILRDDPEDVDANYLLGALLAERGELERAREYTERAARRAPNSPYVQNNLGNIARLSGDLALAAACYTRAIALPPDLAEAHNNLGIVYKRLGQGTEAIACYQRALDANPVFVDAYFNLGKAYWDSGDFSAAEQSFQRALELQPGHVRAQEGLGSVYLQRGENAAALHCFKQCLALDPADACGVRLKMAWLDAGAVPDRYPDALVRATYEVKAATWDDDAARPDMRFLGPDHVREAFAAWVQQRRDMQILDLGCGTGACGSFLRPHAQRLTGVDLSMPMLRVAEQKHCYDALANEEIVSYLTQHTKTYDVIVASGVVIFLGDLAPVLNAARRALRDSGVFIFTTYQSSSADVTVRGNFHFAHSEAHISARAQQAGFTVQSVQSVIHEYDQAVAQPGWLVVLSC